MEDVATQTPPLFHPGRFPKRSKQEQRDYERRRTLEKFQAEQKKTPRAPLSTQPLVFRPPPRWFLPHTTGPEQFFLNASSIHTFKDVTDMLARISLAWAKRKQSSPAPILGPAFISHLNACALQNQRLRWVFKRFLIRWLRQRLRAINDTDPVTLEVPKDPVQIVDWPNRCVYTFEARTLASDMRERILCHDQLFPIPAAPRNVYTNSLLTYGQLFFLHADLRARGVTDWWLSAFAKQDFNFTRFQTIAHMMLRESALNRLFMRNTDPDLIDLVIDFIESEHMSHQQENRFSANLYQWALETEPDHFIIRTWRKLCREFYDAEFQYSCSHRIQEVRNRIFEETEGLCGPAHELVALRARWRRAQQPRPTRVD